MHARACVCVCVCVSAHVNLQKSEKCTRISWDWSYRDELPNMNAGDQIWDLGPEDSLRELILFFQANLGDQTWAISLGSKFLYPIDP